MISYINTLWDEVSLSGIKRDITEREKKEITLLNKAWVIVTGIQIVSLFIHLFNNSYRSGMMTAFYLDGLVVVYLLIRNGRLNAAKICAIIVINLNTILMSVILGEHTRVINFLLLIALAPMFLFEIKDRKYIFAGVALSIIPYVMYHSMLFYLRPYALPAEDQLKIYETTPWIMISCLAALLYLIYSKNANHEHEMEEKEQQLIRQKKMYELILEQIPIDIATFDKELKIQYINSTAVSDPELRNWMIGKTNAAYFEKCGLDMKIVQEREKRMKEALDKEKTVQFEEVFVMPNGETKYSLKGAAPIHSDDKNEIVCLVGYALDITGLKEAEKKQKKYSLELEKKNADMHHFVNATSHDLKTPLRTIVSYLQVVEKNNIGKLDKDSLSMISYTVRSVKRLNKLINDIYLYSMADKEQKPDVVDMNILVTDVLKQSNTLVAERKADITVGSLPILKIASSNMETIFSHLIGNGIKYNTSANPTINISCEHKEDEFVFRIADNGIGIKQEYHSQVFEMFKRLHTNEEFEGTGVGLAICNKIAENYGGRMWVESEFGKGSTFYFSLSKDNVNPSPSDNQQVQLYKNLEAAV